MDFYKSSNMCFVLTTKKIAVHLQASCLSPADVSVMLAS